jgi:hypothetical protein
MVPPLPRVPVGPVLGFALLALPLLGCVEHHYHYHHAGVPHGYAYHQDGVRLVFDSGLDCYVVVSRPHHYFRDGHYYRYHEGRWERGIRLTGPWVVAEVEVLPPGLRRHGELVEHREERREEAAERRDERRDAAREHREERQEEAAERRDERRGAAREHRGDRREEAVERREERQLRAENRRDERSERAEERLEGQPPAAPDDDPDKEKKGDDPL